MKKYFLVLIALLTAGVTYAQIKVLGIGNSFSEDALEQNISEIARSEGVPMVIANLYIGGCSIDRHVENIAGNKAAYRYTKFDVEGNKTIRQNVALESVIGEEQWDYISVQQVSGQSGFYESYVRLPELISWIKKMVPGAKIMLHQTWAYAAESKHSDFPKYDSSQKKMHAAISDAVKRVVAENAIDGIIPSGPAIQNLRDTTGNYDLTRDGYHLSLGMGRSTAACTWFVTLHGKDANTIKYRPDGSDPRTEAITEEEAKLCKKAASEVTNKATGKTTSKATSRVTKKVTKKVVKKNKRRK